jgi:sugar phosphate isomerase/epimerase
MDVFDLLRQARSLGIKVIQVCDNLPLDRLTQSDRVRLRSTADRWGIAIEVGTRGIQREHLDRYLELARFFRSPILRLVLDQAGDQPSPEETVARLGPLVPAFAQAGIRMALENHGRFSAAVLSGLVRELGATWVGICLDTANSLGAGEGLEHTVDQLAPYTVGVHVKDFRIRRLEHQMGFLVEGCAVGGGCLPVPWLIERLRGHRRKVTWILEQWVVPENTLTATLAKERRWARQSIQYLREWIPA